MDRCIFRLIHPYDVLPQDVIDLKTVKSFQNKLHAVVKECTKQDIPEWELFLHKGVYVQGIAFSRKIFEHVVVARPVVNDVPLFHPSTETWW